MSFKKQETALGLAISLALALGYLGGRLHADMPATQTAETIQVSTTPVAPDQRLKPSNRIEPRQDTIPPMAADRAASRAKEKYAHHATGATGHHPPGNIGAFVDPDEIELDAASDPRHIGEPMDPDQHWVQAEDRDRIDIGELMEPDELDQET